jgi:hypothetical protein
MLAMKNMYVSRVIGDGFCFLYSVQSSLFVTTGKFLSCSELQKLIGAHIVDNKDRFSSFHTGDNSELIHDLYSFFEDRNYNRDVVDLIILACAEVLKIKLVIYQEESNHITITEQGGTKDATEVIYLKFAAGHYDAIVPMLVSPVGSDDAEYIDFMAEKEVDCILISSDSENDEKTPACIDLTQEVGSLKKEVKATENMNRRQKLAHDIFCDELDTSTVIQCDDAKENLDDDIDLTQFISTQKRKRHEYDTSLFIKSEPVKVEKVPYNLNGDKWFVIKCGRNEVSRLSSDGRHFEMKSSKRVGLERGKRKVGTCNGSYSCENQKCSFLESSGNKNCSNFQNVNSRANKGPKMHVCFSCGFPATHVPCKAKKVTEYNDMTGKLNVFHLGTHSCTLKRQDTEDTMFIQAAIKKHKDMGPRKLSLTMMKEAMEKGDNAQLDKISRNMRNIRRINNMKSTMNKEVFPDRNSFEAVAKLKSFSDQNDVLHIFSLNPPGMNNTQPYVFKTSKVMVQLALSMDCSGEVTTEQQMEEVYFDGTHSRVTGYKTLTMWTMHVAMRRLVNLASMEVRSEDTDAVSLFFQLFNDALKQVFNNHKKNKDKVSSCKFHPITIMCDENGANFLGIQQQCPGVKVISCQMHYKMCAIQKSTRLPEEERAEFLQMVKDICGCHTVTRYLQLNTQMHDLMKKHPAIESWVRWWEARKYHIVPAYRGAGYKGCNLAEIGHSTLKKRQPMTLLDAVMEDICRVKMQDDDVEDFIQQKKPSCGTGPSQRDSYAKSWQEQNEMAKQYGEILLSGAEAISQQVNKESNDDFVPTQAASHKAPHRPKSKNNIQGKRISKKKKNWYNFSDVLKTAKEVVQHRSTSGTSPGSASQTMNQCVTPSGAATSLPSMSRGSSISTNINPTYVNVPLINTTTALASSPVVQTTAALVTPCVMSPIKYINGAPACVPYIHSSNPPLIWLREGLIKRCQGCRGYIDPITEKLVFRQLAYKPFPDKITKIWQYGKKPLPCYFHLKFQCLQEHNEKVNLTDITITNEILAQLKEDDLLFLDNLGFLEPILLNRDI